jgi:putative transposase
MELSVLRSAHRVLLACVNVPCLVTSGVTVGDVCRQVGISEQTFYRWKKAYGSMLPSEARELKQLRDENAKLKRLVADLSLDKVMLQDVVQKKF